MTPLLQDPTDAAKAASAAEWSVQQIAGSVFAYIGTAFIGWLLSRLAVNRRMTALEASVEQRLTDLEERVMAEIHTLTTEHAAIAQEVWGAQQQNGLRGEVHKLREMQQKHGETLAGIKSMLEVLLKREP